jgi:hypothetical protein
MVPAVVRQCLSIRPQVLRILSTKAREALQFQYSGQRFYQICQVTKVSMNRSLRNSMTTKISVYRLANIDKMDYRKAIEIQQYERQQQCFIDTGQLVDQLMYLNSLGPN